MVPHQQQVSEVYVFINFYALSVKFLVDKTENITTAG